MESQQSALCSGTDASGYPNSLQKRSYIKTSTWLPSCKYGSATRDVNGLSGLALMTQLTRVEQWMKHKSWAVKLRPKVMNKVCHGTTPLYPCPVVSNSHLTQVPTKLRSGFRLVEENSWQLSPGRATFGRTFSCERKRWQSSGTDPGFLPPTTPSPEVPGFLDVFACSRAPVCSLAPTLGLSFFLSLPAAAQQRELPCEPSVQQQGVCDAPGVFLVFTLPSALSVDGTCFGWLF